MLRQVLHEHLAALRRRCLPHQARPQRLLLRLQQLHLSLQEGLLVLQHLDLPPAAHLQAAAGAAAGAGACQ
jgi:hypothetical protein